MNLEQLMAAMKATANTPPKPVEVEGWGTIYLREVTVGEVEEQTRDTENRNDKHRIARAAARVIADKTGKPLFDPDNEEHVKLIAQQPWRLLRRIVEAGDGEKKG